MDLRKIFNSKNLSPFHVDKIYLKIVSQTDDDFIHKLFQCTDVKRYFILREEHQKNLNSFLAFMISRFDNNQGFDFIIYDLENKPVGLITCELESNNENLIGNVSYAIHKDYRNKGYASEALQFICKITDQSQLSILKLDINAENIASQRIAEKLGFKSNKQNALFDINHPDSGLRHAWHRECYKETPKRVELSSNAINCFRQKDYHKAIDLLRESLKYENPTGSPHTDAQIYSNLGMALSSTKQYKEAHSCLMKAYNEGLQNESILKELEWLRTNAGHELLE